MPRHTGSEQAKNVRAGRNPKDAGSKKKEREARRQALKIRVIKRK